MQRGADHRMLDRPCTCLCLCARVYVCGRGAVGWGGSAAVQRQQQHPICCQKMVHGHGAPGRRGAHSPRHMGKRVEPTGSKPSSRGWEACEFSSCLQVNRVRRVQGLVLL